MKRKILLAVVAVMLVAAGYMYGLHGSRERRFFDQAFVQLEGGGGSEPVTMIALASGDSAAVILEHDCCNGGGFDAVAIRISDGEEFLAVRNYCGIEGFYGALEADAIRDPGRFKAFLKAEGFRKR